MKRKDFDPKTLELAEGYAWAVRALLADMWNISLEKEETSDIDKIISQFLFFYTKAKDIEER